MILYIQPKLWPVARMFVLFWSLCLACSVQHQDSLTECLQVNGCLAETCASVIKVRETLEIKTMHEAWHWRPCPTAEAAVRLFACSQWLKARERPRAGLFCATWHSRAPVGQLFPAPWDWFAAFIFLFAGSLLSDGWPAKTPVCIAGASIPLFWAHLGESDWLLGPLGAGSKFFVVLDVKHKSSSFHWLRQRESAQHTSSLIAGWSRNKAESARLGSIWMLNQTRSRSEEMELAQQHNELETQRNDEERHCLPAKATGFHRLVEHFGLC